MTGFDLTIGDVISLTYPRFGWNAKLFEVRKWSYKINTGDALIVELTLRETSAAVYDWNADETSFNANNTILPSPWIVEIPSLEITQDVKIVNQEAFGVITFTAKVNDPSRVALYEIEISEDQAGLLTWKQVGSGNSNTYEWLTQTTDRLTARVRTISPLGVKSAWQWPYLITPEFGTTPPDDVTNFTEIQLGDSLFLNWDPVENDDLSHYEIRYTNNLTGSFDLSQVAISKVARPGTSVLLPVDVGKYFYCCGQ